ncbi:hypothetical protein [Thiolapillus sp.]
MNPSQSSRILDLHLRPKGRRLFLEVGSETITILLQPFEAWPEEVQPLELDQATAFLTPEGTLLGLQVAPSEECA